MQSEATTCRYLSKTSWINAGIHQVGKKHFRFTLLQSETVTAFKPRIIHAQNQEMILARSTLYLEAASAPTGFACGTNAANMESPKGTSESFIGHNLRLTRTVGRWTQNETFMEQHHLQ